MQHSSDCPTKSMESIVHTYGDMLYRLCYVLVQNESDAEDIVQETMLKYFEKKPVLNDEEHKKAWLITVAKNKCKDMLRYKKKHSQACMNEAKEATSSASDTSILETLMAMPPKFRLVLVLYYVEGYHIKDIAKMEGITPSAIKMRLQKGRKLLKEQYKKEVTIDGV